MADDEEFLIEKSYKSIGQWGVGDEIRMNHGLFRVTRVEKGDLSQRLFGVRIDAESD